MPYLRSGSSPSRTETTPEPGYDGQQIVDDHAYAANSFPGYAEKPLSEQLEPIAVVGIGRSMAV